MSKISVIINTFNEKNTLARALSSIKSIASEIVVVDMNSDDGTQDVAKMFGAKLYKHERLSYVEPARNFAIGKATNPWILVLDPDEELGHELINKLEELSEKPKADYYRISRKNIIFGKWLRHSRWWPDYNIRFFKKGSVTWNEVIHSVPMTAGRGMDLPAEERYAIIHHNYPTVGKYIERMNRYSEIQAKTILVSGYKFNWKDLIGKPLSEFLSRFFAGEGYKDGLHGLALSLLQAFSELTVYLKIWQAEKYPSQAVSLDEFSGEIQKSGRAIKWWLVDARIKEKSTISSLPIRIYRRLFVKNG